MQPENKTLNIIKELINNKRLKHIPKEIDKLNNKEQVIEVCQILNKKLQNCYNQIIAIIQQVLKHQKGQRDQAKYLNEKYEIDDEIKKKISTLEKWSNYPILQNIINNFYQKNTKVVHNYQHQLQRQLYNKIVKISKRLQKYNYQNQKIINTDPKQYRTHFEVKPEKNVGIMPISSQTMSLTHSNQGIITPLKKSNDMKDTDKTQCSKNQELNQQIITILKMSDLLTLKQDTKEINIKQILNQLKSIIIKMNRLKKNVDSAAADKKQIEGLKKINKNLQNTISVLDKQLVALFLKNVGKPFESFNPTEKLKDYMEELLAAKQPELQKVPQQMKKQFKQSMDVIYLSKIIDEKSDIEQMKQSILHLKKVLSASLILKDNVVNLKLQEKQFIIDVIEKYHKKNIKNAKQLRFYDEKNTINPHDYIDNKPNILAIVRLKNNQIIAIYSQNPISPQQLQQQHDNLENGQTILMNVNRCKHFYQKPGTFTKHKYTKKDIIIFGDNDIQLKLLDFTVRTKFGTSQSSFQDMNSGPNGLIDFEVPQINEMKWISWEFFQVQFSQDSYEQTLNKQYLEYIKRAVSQSMQKQCQTQIQRQLQAQYFAIRPNIKFRKLKQRLKILQIKRVIQLIHEPIQNGQKEQNKYSSQILDLLDDEKQQQISKLKLQIQKLRNQLESGLDKYSQQMHQIQKSKKIFQLQKQKLKQQILRNHPFFKQEGFLNVKIFEQGKNNEEKRYLIELLQKRQRRKIKGTHFIYQYDELNLTNFHMYIDNVPNLFLVIRTISGNIVGGFIKEGIRESKISYNGFIYTATKKTHFEVNPQTKAIAAVHQPYFLIFGNSELRIRTQDKMLFSNFGILNSFYETKNLKVDFFLGEDGKRQAQIDTLQFYRIDFE